MACTQGSHGTGLSSFRSPSSKRLGTLGSAQPAGWKSLHRPNRLEFQQFMQAIGASPLAAPAVMKLVEVAYNTPYPPHWIEEVDDRSGTIYFYHELEDRSSWQHPLMNIFSEVVTLADEMMHTSLPVQQVAEVIEESLEIARCQAIEDLSDWVGPISTGMDAEYFFNTRTSNSEWEDPSLRWRFELEVRHYLLMAFLKDLTRVRGNETKAAQKRALSRPTFMDEEDRVLGHWSP